MEHFKHLPPSSRVWIYQSDRAFAAQESASIRSEVAAFVSQWLAHKAKVTGDGILLYDRFVILAADEDKLQVSGCSIDSTVRFIKELSNKYQVNFFDRFYTCYLHDGKVEGCNFEIFKERFAQGVVTDETIVFNNLVNTIEGLQNQWQLPLKDSWQSKFLHQEVGIKLKIH